MPDDLRNPFARVPSGELVHVGRVSGREAGPFVCPACEMDLRLRDGEIRRRHFAHAPGTLCETAVESALHHFAKALIQREKRLRLPELWVAVEAERACALSSRMEVFDAAELEVAQEGFRPDLVLHRTVDGVAHRLLVEVRVTHETNRDKRDRIERAGTSAVEVDLRGCDLLDVDALEQAILDEAPRAWLHHRRKHELVRKHGARIAERERIERREAAIRRRAEAERAIAEGMPRRISVAEMDREYALRDLREAAARAFPRDGKRAEQFLIRGHRGLNGISPLSYCRSRQTLERCLALLEAEAGRSYRRQGKLF